MKVCTTVAELQSALQEERNRRKTIGLVPTMGALHSGHLSLVQKCCTEYDVCVASVFVNPTQFNDATDLKTYPRTPENDCRLLSEAGCDYVFLPSVTEIYPEPDTRIFDFGFIGEVMEGAHRPGHFNGVAQVVSRLFLIVRPDGAFFGEKDFQQIAIIRSMVTQLALPVQIHPCPIVREQSGLAMSSRNQRLTPEARLSAPLIYKTLVESTTLIHEKNPAEMTQWVLEQLEKTPHLRPEYYSIVDAITLRPIENWNDSTDPVGCITCYCGDVRLIDNIHYYS